jgi:hypothetical protein
MQVTLVHRLALSLSPSKETGGLSVVCSRLALAITNVRFRTLRGHSSEWNYRPEYGSFRPEAVIREENDRPLYVIIINLARCQAVINPITGVGT